MLLRRLLVGFPDLIEGTANLDAPVEHVNIGHRSPYVFVPQQLLHRSDVIAGVQKVGGETVAQGAAAHGFGDPCGLSGLSDGFLGPALAQVMAAGDAGTRIVGKIAGGKERLPAPGAWVFVFQRRGQIDGAVAPFKILPMDALDVAELLPEGPDEAGGQQRDVSDRALAGTHRDLKVVDIEIADAQTQRLNKAETGALEQPNDELSGGRAGQRVEQAPNLILGEDGGHPLPWLFCPEVVEGTRELLLEHFTVKEQKCAEGLRLGGSRHVLIYSQVGEEGFDFRDIHGLGMALIVEEDEAYDPADIGFLCVKRILPDAQRLPYTI